MSNLLNETNDRLREVRAAMGLADIMRGQIKSDPKRQFRIDFALSSFHDVFPNERSDKALNGALAARLRANLDHALSEAERDLRAEERKLCEELIRLAAKAAAGGL
jgi:hypothetical protein